MGGKLDKVITKLRNHMIAPPGENYWACPGRNGWTADCKGLQAYNEGAGYKMIHTNTLRGICIQEQLKWGTTKCLVFNQFQALAKPE